MNWHQKSVDEILGELNTSIKGLVPNEAQKRLDEYGRNELKEKKKKTSVMIFIEQFSDFMILVLIAAAIISGIIGEISDTIAIIVIIVLNAIIGFVQEYRAEKAMAALKKMTAQMVTVTRDGKPANIPAVELVPGDIVLLEAGKVVPSDMRLIETAQLKIEEAALTGESHPVEKHIKALHNEKIPLADRKNMAYRGTTVSYGRGTGIVVATGMATELGKIAFMLQNEEEVKTPLQKRLASFGKRLAIAVLAICAIVFIVGMLRGERPLLMFLTAVSLAVAAIPEALPAVITISLALGAKSMVRQNALIRKLAAVETLGSITYICSDKTGTLTLNKMTVEDIYIAGESVKNGSSTTTHQLSSILTALALSNDVQTDASGSEMGDPTEIALFNIAKEKGVNKSEVESWMPRVAEIPFDSTRKRMTTFHKTINRHPQQTTNYEPPPINYHLSTRNFISFTKGAVEAVIEKADYILTADGISVINKDEIFAVNEKMAADGLRVLCVAIREWDTLPQDITHENVETGLTVLGLVGMMDPPREEAIEAVSICRAAGIKPVMITGDHPVTAMAIAKRVGIIDDDSKMMITGKELESLSPKEFDDRVENIMITGDYPITAIAITKKAGIVDNKFKTIITGRELEGLSPKEFDDRVENIKIYARVAPEQKLKIVKALQDKGQFVAMTGDGVNDAPALKRADIGVAMGITGTDVSKEAAHMILLDDNFATIVKAVREGRKIYDNIRKFIKYMLTTNSAEIWTLFLAPLLGLPIPLLPIHILWVNLATDGLPALALSAEPEEGNLMIRPPRHPKESIFAHGLGLHAIWVGLLMGGTTIFTQAWSISTGHGHWQTMVFSVLCLSQMGHVLAIRSETQSLFTQGILSNKPLLGAVVVTFVAQMATIYVPFLNPIFKTEPLSFNELLLTLALSSVIFFAVEIEKLCRRRRALNV